MKYVILVSHGEYANGLKDALSMLSGERNDVISIGLKNGKSADEFAIEFNKKIKDISNEDEIILLGDLIGGSPLTTAMNVITGKGLMDNTIILGGMNLPLALTTILMKDVLDKNVLVEQVLQEAHSALKEFKIELEEDEI